MRRSTVTVIALAASALTAVLVAPGAAAADTTPTARTLLTPKQISVSMGMDQPARLLARDSGQNGARAMYLAPRPDGRSVTVSTLIEPYSPASFSDECDRWRENGWRVTKQTTSVCAIEDSTASGLHTFAVIRDLGNGWAATARVNADDTDPTGMKIARAAAVTVSVAQARKATAAGM